MRAIRTLTAAAIALAALSPVATRAADSFFAGKTVTIIAGFPPGGGVDGMARLLARHIGDFIPGHPDTLVKNIPGAAGNVAANHLYNKAEPDGLTLAVPGRGWMTAKMFGEPGIAFEALKFAYIGSTGVDNSLFWIRSELGITNAEQLKNAKQTINIAAYSKRGHQYIVPKILAEQGWPLKVLAGYRGTTPTLLAAERKEIDGIFLPMGSFMTNRRDLIENKYMIPILQTHNMDPKVTWVLDVVPEEKKPVVELVVASQGFGVPLVAPPGTPADRIAVLQKAFMDMAMDGDFQKDAEKNGVPTGAPYSGKAIRAEIARILALPQKVVDEYKEYAGKGSS